MFFRNCKSKNMAINVIVKHVFWLECWFALLVVVAITHKKKNISADFFYIYLVNLYNYRWKHKLHITRKWMNYLSKSLFCKKKCVSLCNCIFINIWYLNSATANSNNNNITTTTYSANFWGWDCNKNCLKIFLKYWIVFHKLAPRCGNMYSSKERRKPNTTIWLTFICRGRFTSLSWWLDFPEREFIGKLK